MLVGGGYGGMGNFDMVRYDWLVAVGGQVDESPKRKIEISQKGEKAVKNIS